jgi:hypothetical protein
VLFATEPAGGKVFDVKGLEYKTENAAHLIEPDADDVELR